MSDFEGIPSEGDTFGDEEVEEDDEESELEVEEATKKWRFNGKHIYVMWSKSKIDKEDVFHQKLLAILPAGVRLYNGRELHKDGTPHYHVVMSFLHKVNWADAAKKFSIDPFTLSEQWIKRHSTSILNLDRGIAARGLVISKL
jgi:hypothetical protein